MIRQLRFGFIGNISVKSEREKYTGILRYAATHPGITIEEFYPSLFSAEISHKLIKHWSPDGVIVSAPAGYDYVNDLPDSLPIGLIDHFENIEPATNIHFNLLADEDNLARSVARHYLRRRFGSFAYFGYEDKERSLLRQRAFSLQIEKAGHDTSSFLAHWTQGGNLSQEESKRLHRFLKKLPFPCAAFVYWDYLAKQILSTCSEMGIKIPEQLSIISADNEEFICENTHPTLSSVELNFQSVGYQAAQRLHEILIGKKPSPPLRKIAYGMTRIVERISSSDQSGTVRLLMAAKEIIRTEACKGLTAAALAQRLNISQRYLEMHFKKTLGTTPCAEIKKRKINEAKRLLSQTQLPLVAIATRAGFKSSHHLHNIFSANVGASMKTYRAQSQCS